MGFGCGAGPGTGTAEAAIAIANKTVIYIVKKRKRNILFELIILRFEQITMHLRISPYWRFDILNVRLKRLRKLL